MRFFIHWGIETEPVSIQPVKTTRNRFRVFVTLLTVIVLIGLWYTEENYRGRRAWNTVQQQLSAHQESLSATHFVPAPIPDDQNLAMAPLLTELFNYQVDPVTGILTFDKDVRESKAYKELIAMPFGLIDDRISRPAKNFDFASGHALDLEAYRKYYRRRDDFEHSNAPELAAAEVLLALGRYRAFFDDLAKSAAERPLGRFPVNWMRRPSASISFPHGTLIQSANTALRLRACAHLALGETEAAFRDIALGFRLLQTIDAEPALFSNAVEYSGLQLLLQPIWEGLIDRRWSAIQLVGFQTLLGSIDVLQSLHRAQQSERALFVLPMLNELRRPLKFREFFGSTVGKPEQKDLGSEIQSAIRFLPVGWAESSMATACQWEQKYAIDPIDLVARRIHPSQMEGGEAALQKLWPTPTNMLIRIALPLTTPLAVKNARLQSAQDEAVTACALERYYLDHQAYPANLNALVPVYLVRIPTDVIDGSALRYKLTSNGRFRLWEAGWNGTEEDGKVIWKDKNRLDDKLGDWVWQYALTTPGGT